MWLWDPQSGDQRQDHRVTLTDPTRLIWPLRGMANVGEGAKPVAVLLVRPLFLPSTAVALSQNVSISRPASRPYT